MLRKLFTIRHIFFEGTTATSMTAARCSLKSTKFVRALGNPSCSNRSNRTSDIRFAKLKQQPILDCHTNKYEICSVTIKNNRRLHTQILKCSQHNVKFQATMFQSEKLFFGLGISHIRILLKVTFLTAFLTKSNDNVYTMKIDVVKITKQSQTRKFCYLLSMTGSNNTMTGLPGEKSCPNCKDSHNSQFFRN